jgi:hypothetical protein
MRLKRIAVASATVGVLVSLGLPTASSASATIGLSTAHPAAQAHNASAVSTLAEKMPSAKTDGQRQIAITRTTRAPARDSDALPAAATAACDKYYRTRVCSITDVAFAVLRDRKKVGYLTATIKQEMKFSTKSRTFTEKISLRPTLVEDEAAGIRVNLGVSCGNPCRATSKPQQERQVRLGRQLHWKISYTDNVKRKKAHSTASHYSWTYVKTGFPPINDSWNSIGYRCDDKFWFVAESRWIPGCVIPRATAIMTTMRQLPAISANIRRIQTNGPGHYGQPGSGHPLHRLTNTRQRAKNRRDVCGRNVVGTPPKNKTCDEYPFASTTEGGTTLGTLDRGVAWVPETEQHQQGGLVIKSYREWRVLAGDAFYVAV